MQEHAAGYLEAMKLYSSAEFRISDDPETKFGLLENLAEEGEISRTLTIPWLKGAVINYSRKAPQEGGEDVDYKITASLRRSFPERLKIEIHTEQDIHRALNDFGALTGFYRPEVATIKVRPEEKPKVIWGEVELGDLIKWQTN